MKNRRNYYRILHVQPEAPPAVIRASYRSLMSTLRHHPDLGGDHATAVLINEAYAVLGDPRSRQRYDDSLRAQRRTPRADPASAAPIDDGCPFCAEPHEGVARCARCASPLSLSPPRPTSPAEVFGRRSTPRVARSAGLRLYPHWPHAGHRARLHDVSVAGLSVVTAYAPRRGQLLKLDAEFVQCIARVVDCRASGTAVVVHASFVTVAFGRAAGVSAAE